MGRVPRAWDAPSRAVAESRGSWVGVAPWAAGAQPPRRGSRATAGQARNVTEQGSRFRRPPDEANPAASALVFLRTCLSKRRVLSLKASQGRSPGLLQARMEPSTRWKLPGCSEPHGG